MLHLKDTNQDVDHGKMTTFIRHKKPYTVQCCEPFILSFTLEHNINLRCVLGLPTLLSIEAAITLLSGELFCTGFNQTFPLILDPLGKGLPDGTSLNTYLPFNPPDALTDITSTTFLFK